MEQLKKTLKMCAALMLALVIAITATGTTAEAASVKLTKANSGKVSCVLYKGAKAKKATFKLNSSTFRYHSSLYPGYDVYDVNVTLTRANLSKTDIIKTVKESKKKGTNILDYAMIMVDANGNSVSGLNYTYPSYSDSSSYKTLKATSGNTRYYISGWRKKTVYTGSVYIPQGQSVYLGFAGLRNGQIKKSVYNKWINGNKTYYSAGFGKTKKGYAIAGQIA